jgi:hypothetical protein
MNKLNVAAVAGMLAVAAVLGTIAATHTVSLGASHQKTASSTLRAQAKKLDRFETALRRQLAKKPPKLPAVPKTPAVAPARAPQQAQQQVVYRRPPPVVVVKHTHHGDDGSEHEGSGEGGGEGGDD